MAMYPSVGYKRVKMKLFTCVLSISNCGYQCFIIEEFALSDRFIDTSQILVYNPSCTNIQVPYFRVAHLAFRKTNSFTTSSKGSVRILFQVTVIVRFVSLSNGVAF
ncbi:hypothetical protein D3C76_744110 [compost metagenome]